EQIDPAVAVDVTRADAMPGGLTAEVVFHQLASLSIPLLRHLVPDDDVDRVGQDVGDAVPREIDHPGGLAASGLILVVLGRGGTRFPRILDPAHVLAEV